MQQLPNRRASIDAINAAIHRADEAHAALVAARGLATDVTKSALQRAYEASKELFACAGLESLPKSVRQSLNSLATVMQDQSAQIEGQVNKATAERDPPRAV